MVSRCLYVDFEINFLIVKGYFVFLFFNINEICEYNFKG